MTRRSTPFKVILANKAKGAAADVVIALALVAIVIFGPVIIALLLIAAVIGGAVWLVGVKAALWCAILVGVAVMVIVVCNDISSNKQADLRHRALPFLKAVKKHERWLDQNHWTVAELESRTRGLVDAWRASPDIDIRELASVYARDGWHGLEKKLGSLNGF